MGCMYSKAIARSMSVRDEVSRRSSWEGGATDHLFALVYSAATAKPRTSSVALPREPNDSSAFDRVDTGSRSFHTVEEYDALLERIHKFSSRSVQHFEDQDYDDRYSSGSDDENQDIQETGWKRKEVGRGIKPLEVSTIEFPDVGRWRQRVRLEGDEQVFSPGNYVTPKFGSYNERMLGRREDNGESEGSVFSRELVAAFEDCMQQLEDEEESILREMDSHDLEGDDDL